MYGSVCYAIDSYCADPDERKSLRRMIGREVEDVYLNPCQQCFGKECAECEHDYLSLDTVLVGS